MNAYGYMKWTMILVRNNASDPLLGNFFKKDVDKTIHLRL